MRQVNDIWNWQEIPKECGKNAHVATIDAEVSAEICSHLIPALAAARGNPDFAPSAGCNQVEWQEQFLELVSGWIQDTEVIWCSGCLHRFLKEAVILKNRYTAFRVEENLRIFNEMDSHHE